MCDTVLTLANNQIVQNETKSGNKKLSKLNMLTEDEAREGLRSAKGNIWQAIDKCVKAKQAKIAKDSKQRMAEQEPKKSFSFKISGNGSGKENEDRNENVLEQGKVFSRMFFYNYFLRLIEEYIISLDSHPRSRPHPQFLESQPMGPELRKPKNIGCLPRELQPNDISLFESLGIAF